MKNYKHTLCSKRKTALPGVRCSSFTYKKEENRTPGRFFFVNSFCIIPPPGHFLLNNPSRVSNVPLLPIKKRNIGHPGGFFCQFFMLFTPPALFPSNLRWNLNFRILLTPSLRSPSCQFCTSKIGAKLFRYLSSRSVSTFGSYMSIQ